MSPLATVATCNLDQWALDFDGNLARIKQSIVEAKSRGATYRMGPELEVTGYGCEDHFLEQDTFLHSWQSLGEIIDSDLTDGILCDIGMPVMHKSVRYNCRVIILNRKILLIRPKMFLADDGNYRESRWFTAWGKGFSVEDFTLPDIITQVNKQVTCPIGVGIVECRDTSIGCETCEELWTPDSPNIQMLLDGVEIIGNGSGSHFELRKLQTRMDLIRGATAKAGGVYLYANQQGCDGGRLNFDGGCLIAVNGHVVAQGSQFSLRDVEVIIATVDLDDVRSYRAAVSSRGQQASRTPSVPRVQADIVIANQNWQSIPSAPLSTLKLLSGEEEIAYGPACWLWDFLRRSGAGGFFVPLSGGADSTAVVAIVGCMCQLVVRAIRAGESHVLEDVRRVCGNGDDNYTPHDAAELASRILHTCYMGTTNSSVVTRTRAKKVAGEIGGYHLDASIDAMVSAVVSVFTALVNKSPRFLSQGGTIGEDIALQNIQARLRMVFSYLLAQLLPWVRGRRGFLLVLATANVDEGLRGYMTKYDCSSGDLNPIGSISKEDLKRFLTWASPNLGYPSLSEVVAAPPTAELRPMGDASGATEHSQLDEEDMGMTYAELGWFGRLRKVARCGPVSMFQKLVHAWSHISPAEVAVKVKRFFTFYSINRHKQTTVTPSVHCESYSPEDNRFDLRPFLYNTRWPRQFRTIDALVDETKKAE
eukprot:GILK01002675.1.p1 GENE.GILK01002675.1~~GILK01002675.1.p1  ORF type:complete len:704 (-),score=84.43 GILK01002675.1:103-2214(-)